MSAMTGLPVISANIARIVPKNALSSDIGMIHVRSWNIGREGLDCVFGSTVGVP